MSPDELILLFLSVGLALWGWSKWYRVLYGVWQPTNAAGRLELAVLPVVMLLAISVVVGTIAAFDVIGHPAYIFFYIVLGMAWLVLMRELVFMLFDVSWRDDVVERGNSAAAVVVCGSMLGLTAIYCGSNVGDGPGWWVVFFTGIFGTALWFAFGLLFNKFSSAFERVTVGRELGCGIRTALYLLSSGIVLGRACAGDWVSAEQTIIEFWQAWPMLLVFALALVVERKSSSIDASTVREAVRWGLTYLLVAVAAMFLLPSLTQNLWWQ